MRASRQRGMKPTGGLNGAIVPRCWHAVTMKKPESEASHLERVRRVRDDRKPARLCLPTPGGRFQTDDCSLCRIGVGGGRVSRVASGKSKYNLTAVAGDAVTDVDVDVACTVSCSW